MQRTSKSKPNLNKLSNKCPTTGKIRLRDKIEAIDILHTRLNKRQRDLDVKGSTKANEVRAYKCTHCRGWHLTSLETWSDNPSIASVKTSSSASSF